MKNINTIIFLFFLFTGSPEIKSQNYSWAKQAGGAGADEAYNVAWDNSGNSYITGSFSGTATFQSTTLTSAGGSDMFIAKYDASGNLSWVLQAGDAANQQGHMVATDASGNVFVCGEFEGTITFGTQTYTSSGMMDIFLVQYNSSGTVQWSVKGGSTGADEANSLKTDPTGNAYLIGNFESVLYFGAQNLISTGSKDIYVAKFSTFGGMTWLVRAGGIMEDDGRGLAVDNSGNVCITGWFQQVANFGALSLNAIGNMQEIFIARMTTGGIFSWAVKAGGVDNDGAYEADADVAGNFYVTGSYKGYALFGTIALNSNGGSDDVFVTMVDPAGIFYWAVTAGGAGSDKGYCIAHSTTGKIFVTGSYEGTASFGTTTLISNGDKDIFIAGMNLSGGYQWAWSAGGAGYDRGYGIDANAAGSVWMTGRMEQNVSFGTTLLTSAGMNDVFLARIETVVSVAENNFDNGITVFPNPFSGRIAVSGLQFPATLKVYNVLGKEFFSENISAFSIQLATDRWQNGIYLLRIISDENISVAKIVKQ